jgi:hypothetical protein
MMRIVDVRWTPAINMLVIACECGRRSEHRADRWMIRCSCGRREQIEEVRGRWLREHQPPGK